jgi:hypothetical protein
MRDKYNNAYLYNCQRDYEIKNSLQGYTVNKLSLTSLFPAQKWMMDKRMQEVKMKK